MSKPIKILILAILISGLIGEITLAYTIPDFPPESNNNNPNDFWKHKWDDRWEDILKNHSPNPALKWIGLISIAVNIILLFTLLIIYIKNFRYTKSYFILGLSFFIGVLLMQKIMFYFFPIIPQVFETVALIILLILSIE